MSMIRTLSVSAALAAAFVAGAAQAQTLQPGELSDAQSAAAISAAEAKAHELHASVCIAVVDSSGVLKAFEHMEGAAPGCVDSAIAKARAAAIYRIRTFAFMQRVNKGEPALVTLPGMVPLGGGVSSRDAGGVWRGAVGAAGSINPTEVDVAEAGAAALTGQDAKK